MGDIRDDAGGGWACPPDGGGGCRAPDVVARLGGPVWVDAGPGRVTATCAGLTGVGPDRAAALRALAERAGAAPT